MDIGVGRYVGEAGGWGKMEWKEHEKKGNEKGVEDGGEVGWEVREKRSEKV